jgi:cbb3-type cytochrome oxidase subunit 3
MFKIMYEDAKPWLEIAVAWAIVFFFAYIVHYSVWRYVGSFVGISDQAVDVVSVFAAILFIAIVWWADKAHERSKEQKQDQMIAHMEEQFEDALREALNHPINRANKSFEYNKNHHDSRVDRIRNIIAMHKENTRKR